MLDLFILSSATQTCYWPSGKTAGALIPCNETVPVSHCCKDSDVCLSNGLCFSPGLGVLVRRGCTDKSWNSTDCPSNCLAGKRPTDETGAPRNPKTSSHLFPHKDKYKAADIVMTVCETYGDFCCGQDDAARACCNLNGTNGPEKVATGGVVLAKKWCPSSFLDAPAAAPVCNSTNSQFQVAKRTAIGLGVVLAVSLLASVWLLVAWYKLWRVQRRPRVPNLAPPTKINSPRSPGGRTRVSLPCCF